MTTTTLLIAALVLSALANVVLAIAYVSHKETLLAATREGWRAGREMYRESLAQFRKDVNDEKQNN